MLAAYHNCQTLDACLLLKGLLPLLIWKVKRERDPPWTDSLPEWLHNSHSWSSPGQAWSPQFYPSFSLGGRDWSKIEQFSATVLCALAGIWIRSQAARTGTNILVQHSGHCRQWLEVLCYNIGPRVFLFAALVWLLFYRWGGWDYKDGLWCWGWGSKPILGTWKAARGVVHWSQHCTYKQPSAQQDVSMLRQMKKPT